LELQGETKETWLLQIGWFKIAGYAKESLLGKLG
jgi:hypothetical protein